MSRYATWRRNPEDPETVRQWFFRTDLDRDGRLLITVLVISALAGLSVWLGQTILIFVAAPGLSSLLNRKEERRILEIVENPPPVDVLPAALVVHDAQGSKTGKDVGWLMVVDGWLVFEGRRVSMSVSRYEARGWMANRAIHLRLGDGRLCNLFPLHGKPKAIPLDGLLERWNQAPVPQGEAVLPPRETHPEIWSDRFALWFFAAFGLVAVSGLTLAYLFPAALVALFGASICLIEALACVGKLRKELPTSLPSRVEPQSPLW